MTLRSICDKTPAGSPLARGHLPFTTLLLLYLLGVLFPESLLWGVHQLAYIPLPAELFIFAVLLLSLFPAFSRILMPRLEKFAGSLFPLRRSSYPVLVLLAVTGSYFFYVNRVAIDMYGDARTLLRTLSSYQFTITDVLGFQDFEPLTRYLHQVISTVTHLDQQFVYQSVSSISGGIFLVLYIWFAGTSTGSPLWRLFILISGLLCGANQLFFGYVEDYTLVYICMIVFLILVWKAFEGKNTLPWVLLCFIVGAKLHVQMILFAPSLVYLIVFKLSGRNSSLGAWITRSRVVLAVCVSILLCAGLYFFVFKAQVATADGWLNERNRIFLPLINKSVSSRGYTLLSWMHGSDILQVIFLAVSPGLLILLAASLSLRRFLRWDSPRTVFYGIALFYFLLFDYTINPMLTPMRDWDMLSLVMPSMLFFGNSLALDVFDRFRESGVPRRIVGISFAFGMIPLVFFFINSHPDIAANRLRGLGIWAYKSYYNGSGYILNVGCMLIPERNREIAERERILRLIGPDTASVDIENALLSYKLAVVLQTIKEYQRAEAYYKKSLAQDPYNASAIKALSVVYLFQWRFEEAATLIERFNENLNVAEVRDFQSLLIAQYAHQCMYLARQHRDKGEIEALLTQLEPKVTYR